MTPWAVRLVITLPALLLVGGSPAYQPPSNKAVIQKYCSGCHNARLKAGNFALDAATVDDPLKQAEAWEKVVRKFRGRYMPPAGLPRPDERTYESLMATLESALDRAPVHPGRTDTFRRLTRTEYGNTIRDLLALDIDVSALLPDDEASRGFDNITVANLSPALLERYLNAAQKVSRLAIGIPPKSPGGDTVTLPPDLTQEAHFEGLPVGTRGGLAVRYTFPVDGEYDIQIRLARDRNEHVEGLAERHEVELLLDGERAKVFTVVPPAGGDHTMADAHLRLRMKVAAGPHTVAATFPKKATLLLETERQPWHAHFNMDRHPRIQPAVFSLTVNGPYEAKVAADTPSRRRVLICSPEAGREEACARTIFKALVRRAYRRPADDADITGPMRFFSAARAEGFEHGIEMGLRAILVSPEFLFRIENSNGLLTDVELASRLSFFLWSSIPDEPLLKDAEAGQLRSRMDHHVRRMLADSRSSALVQNFASQWLHLRNLSSANPDMRLFPDFDDNLRQAFRRETELFLESVLREDRSILELLTADYTFLNERLAKHYGVPKVYGSRFRRISVPGRGGLLRHGSVLTVTSYANRTSPVIRGKWVLDNILGVPPPPPPASVPALKENTGSAKPLPIRERLAQHRSNAACFGCHQLMDPVGFALENYDAVGRWRTADEGMKIDSGGALPDGTKFSGVEGMQKALLSRPDVFATNFAEKLLTYATGRGADHHDAAAIRKVVRDAKANGYKLSSFIAGIAASTSFQMRSSQ